MQDKRKEKCMNQEFFNEEFYFEVKPLLEKTGFAFLAENVFFQWIISAHDSLQILGLIVLRERFCEKNLPPMNLLMELVDVFKKRSSGMVTRLFFEYLQSIINKENIHIIVPLSDSESPDIRSFTAKLLANIEVPLSIESLIKLSRDVESDVRDWATFGLAIGIKSTSNEVVNALTERLEDADDNTRAEAIMGLALRNNEAVIAKIIEELKFLTVGKLVIEAAAETGDKRLCSSLRQLKQMWSQNKLLDSGDDMDEALENAIFACCN
jgi:hypothetical protein